MEAVNTKYDFSLPAVSGKEISPSSYPDAKGYIVLFTCNHCPYAVAYEKRLLVLQEKYDPQGFPIIAINSNDVVRYPADSFSRMQERAKQRGFNFEYLWDESQAIASSYGAQRTPHVFLLDHSLNLIYQGSIDDNWEYENRVNESFLEDAISAFQKGEAPKAARTASVGCSIKWK